jgi:hypothetical protein
MPEREGRHTHQSHHAVTPASRRQTAEHEHPDPYEIRLRHGVRCGLSTGATGVIAGLRLNYGCTNGAWLLGSPNRNSPLWRILYLPSLKASHATSVPILVARW